MKTFKNDHIVGGPDDLAADLSIFPDEWTYEGLRIDCGTKTVTPRAEPMFVKVQTVALICLVLVLAFAAWGIHRRATAEAAIALQSQRLADEHKRLADDSHLQRLDFEAWQKAHPE